MRVASHGAQFQKAAAREMSSEIKHSCGRISQKWVFSVMGFFAIFCAFSLRLSLPLTIPKMVQRSAQHTQKAADDTCPAPSHNGVAPLANVTLPVAGTYDWDEYTQGIILGSFYWGYVASHVPGGMLADRFGGKHTLGLGILMVAFLTIITPLVISWGGAMALIWLRVAMGLSEGITHPAIAVMMAQWVPPNERSKISSCIFIGANLGVLFSSLVLGPMIRSMDWPGVYYLLGGVGVIWYILWSILCYNNPREHPFITEREIKELSEQMNEHTHADTPPVPWKYLLTSAPFWALVAVSMGRDWGGYTYISDMPKYTMGVLKFTVDENGLLFLVVNFSMLASCPIFSWLADWLIEKGYMTRTNVRKLMTTLGVTVYSATCVVTAYVGCNKLQYFIITFISSIIGGAGNPGVKANLLDLSPNYAGTVTAISHGLAGLCGIAAPYVVAVLAPNQTLTEWRAVYWVIFGVSVITNLIYLFFASGDVQEWNDPSFNRKQNKSENVQFKNEKEAEKLLTQEKIQIVTSQVEK